jgi:hypothetical protein
VVGDGGQLAGRRGAARPIPGRVAISLFWRYEGPEVY